MAGQEQAQRDQLEVIGPGGEIRFYDLDPARGLTNIGCDPNNDLVIDSPGVAPFHAVIDHRRRPFQIMLLTAQGETRLRGLPAPANEFQDLNDWDSLEIDGHSIVLLQGAAPVPAAARPIAMPRPEEEAEPAARPAATRPGLPPRDQADEVILTELSAREWTVDVEQTANCQLRITNGGSIVATFSIAVEGVPRNWVTISPPKVNLNEGAHASVSITITPPRLPTSRAGVHPLVIVVTSPNYPQHVSRIGGSLSINPYYAFSLGEISPRQQTVSWRKPTGQVTVPITNEGNSDAPFRVEGEDDERGCRFEFEDPGKAVTLVRQTEARLQPEQTLTLPIAVTPMRRRVVALRKRHYAFTITATLLEGALGGVMPRAVMGRLSAKPLIGPLLLLLILAALAALIVFWGRPAAEPLLYSDLPRTLHGEPVALTYNAARFPTLSAVNVLNGANSLFLRLTLEYKPRDGSWRPLKTASELETPHGVSGDSPLEDGHYRLRAENWLSALIPALTGFSREVPIDVAPVDPEIVLFKPDQARVYVGQPVVLVWTVKDADNLKLSYDETGTPIEEDLQDDELASGQRTFTCNKDTTFTLMAANSSGSEPVRKSVRVMVMAQPVPTPVILRFDVEPLEILMGETVRLGWEVTGADSVMIRPMGEGLPLKGDVGAQPSEMTVYQLIASKTGPDGVKVENQSLLKEVIVNPLPTGTPVPQVPVIDLFEATPKEVIAGKAQVVKLTWSVAGTTTGIEITAPDLAISGLSSQDTVTVTVDETTLFVLTALNGDLKASKAVEVKAIEPTPTATPTPTPVPPSPEPTAVPTGTPFPPPNITFYRAEALDPLEDSVVFVSSAQGQDGPVYTYQVIAGSRVKLSWGVKGADVVTVTPFGTQPSEGEIALPEPVTVSGNYILTAENNEGANQRKAFILLDVISSPPPPPPNSVAGVENRSEGTISLSWSYASSDRVQIDGFRVYRSNVPPGNDFLPVWTLYDPNASSWTDQPPELCGKAYYVVAIYTDLPTGEERETAASGTSWYSQPCQ